MSNMVRDMTEGKPLRLILSFCIPLLLGTLFQQLYNMADSIIVGQCVSVGALAAVGATGSLHFLVLGFATGLCNGFAIPVSQCFGAGDVSDMRRYVANAMYLSAAVAVVLTVFSILFTPAMLRLMNTPDDIFEDARRYIIVVFAGTAATILYNILAGFLRALGDSKTPLYFLVISSVLNILLDLIFILVFSMGVTGAAAATVIAQGVSAVLCLVFIRIRLPVFRFEKEELAPSLPHMRKLLGIGVPMALQSSITAVGTIILQTAVNSLGSGAVAAVTAANKIQLFITQPLATLGLTMATFCGQNLGAGRLDRIRQGVRQSMAVQLVYSAAACVLICFGGYYLALLFVDSGETLILEQAARFLRVGGFFYPMLGILFILRNSLQGLGYGFLPMMAGACELGARLLVSLCLVRFFQFDAICFADAVAWVAAAILMIIVWFVKSRELNQNPKLQGSASYSKS